MQPDRERDERDLKILHMWYGGMTHRDIARKLRITHNVVNGIITRVKEADMKLCGNTVRRFYERG